MRQLKARGRKKVCGAMKADNGFSYASQRWEGQTHS